MKFTLVASLLSAALAVSGHSSSHPKSTTTTAPTEPTRPAYTPPAAWSMFPNIIGQASVLLWIQATPFNASAGAQFLPFSHQACEFLLSPEGKALACAPSYETGKNGLNDTINEFALFRNISDVTAFLTNPDIVALREVGGKLLKGNVVNTFEFFN